MIRKIIKTKTEKNKILNFMHLTNLSIVVIHSSPFMLTLKRRGVANLPAAKQKNYISITD